MPATLENPAIVTGLEKVSFHSNPKERQCQRIFKLPHNCTHLTLAKKCSKSFQASIQQCVNHELPDVQTGFRKGKGTRDQIANILWIIKKARTFQKKHIFVYALCCYHWRRKWQPTPVFLPGKSHGRRSLVGYSP